MAKVAIKSENITSFGGIYHVMDVFSKLGFEKHCGIKEKINIPLFLLVSSKGIVTLLFVNTLQIKSTKSPTPSSFFAKLLNISPFRHLSPPSL